MKRFVYLILVVVVFAGCGSSELSEPVDADVQQEEIIPALVPADLLSNPEQYVGQTVTLTGTVQHVCEVTGKRMFLSGTENPDKTFKVTAGRGIGEFSVGLNGSDVEAKGEVVVRKVNQAYLDNWETEMSTGVKPEAAHEGHGSGGEEPMTEQEESRMQLEKMRENLAKSGKDQLLFYSLECTEYSEKL
jgi:hypothetical protein